MSQGATQGGQGRVQTDRMTEPGAHAFISKHRGNFGVSGLRPDWSIQTKKTRILISSQETYLRGTQGEGPGKQGRLSLTGAPRDVTPRAYYICL